MDGFQIYKEKIIEGKRKQQIAFDCTIVICLFIFSKKTDYVVDIMCLKLIQRVKINCEKEKLVSKMILYLLY